MRLIELDDLMCAEHWQAVPKPAQHAVWRTLSGVKQQGHITQEYWKARAVACDAAAKAEQVQGSAAFKCA